MLATAPRLADAVATFADTLPVYPTSEDVDVQLTRLQTLALAVEAVVEEIGHDFHASGARIDPTDIRGRILDVIEDSYRTGIDRLVADLAEAEERREQFIARGRLTGFAAILHAAE